MPAVAVELGGKAPDFESPSTKDGKLKHNFPLLSDFPNMKTIEAYGVLNPQSKLAQRSYFIVDKRGIVRYKKVQECGAGLVSNPQLVEEIRKINQAN